MRRGNRTTPPVGKIVLDSVLVHHQDKNPGPTTKTETRPTVGSYGEAFSYERGTPVGRRGTSRAGLLETIQGYLVHKKQRPPRTLQQDLA